MFQIPRQSAEKTQNNRRTGEDRSSSLFGRVCVCTGRQLFIALTVFFGYGIGIGFLIGFFLWKFHY